MKTPILGSAYVARSVNAADNRMVNLFPEVVPEAGKEPGFLNRAPGLRLLTTIGNGPIRGLWTFGGFGYVVSGTKLYKIDTLYNATLLGTVDGTGPVSMASNINTAEIGSNAQLMIACNPNSYIYDTTTGIFSQITNTVTANFTGSTAPVSFTGSISGTNLTVTAVSSGTIQIGMPISGSGILAGTTISSQTSGTTGNTGVYVINNSQTVGSITITGNTLLTVTAVGSGTIQPGMFISGTGISLGTNITSQLSGTEGKIGVYVISAQQTVASTSITGTIDSNGFRGAKLVDFISPGYFVAMQPNGLTFQISALNDGLTWDILDFSTVDGSPDALVSMIVDHNEIWLFGTQSVEVWYYTGAVDFPFSRIQGAFNEIGCAATYSVAKLDNGLFWLGADARGQGIVYRSNGYTGARISTHAIEYAIAQYDVISDAIAYTYQQEGHSFYVLTFPTANATWVYDATTQLWHERGSWENAQFRRHRSNCQMAFNGEVILGDFANGNIYAFDLAVYSDNGQTQRWVRSWRALPAGQNDLKRTAHHSLQLDCESGVGTNAQEFIAGNLNLSAQNDYALITESGDNIVLGEYTSLIATDVNPKVMLRWSDDGGHTWSNEHWAEIGKVGRYGHRVFWRRLGMTLKLRDRVYELSGTDPVKIVIMGAELQASGTNA